MENFSVTYHYAESSSHPFSFEWISENSLFISRHSHLDRHYKKYDKSEFSDYYSDSPAIKIIKSPLFKDEIVILRKNLIEKIQEYSGTLQSSIVLLPFNVNQNTCLVCSGGNELIIVTENGEIWRNSKNNNFIKCGSSNISKITKILMFDDYTLLLFNAEGMVEVYNLLNRSVEFNQHLHADSIQGALIVNNKLFTVGRDKALRSWNYTTYFEINGSIESLHDHFINCCIKVNNFFWTGSSDGTIAVVSLDTLKVISKFNAHKDSIRSLKLSQGNPKVASLSDDGTCKIFDIHSHHELYCHGSVRNYIRCSQIVDYNSTVEVAIGNTDGSIKIGTIIPFYLEKYGISKSSLRAVCFLKKDFIVTGNDDGFLIFLNAKTNSVKSSTKHGNGITSLLYVESRKYLISGHRDGYIRIYKISDIENGTLNLLHQKKIHNSIVGDIILYDNNSFLSCSDDRTIKQSFVDSLSILCSFSYNSTSAINNLNYTNDYIISTTDGGEVLIFLRYSYKFFCQYNGHSYPVRALTFLIDNIVCTGDRNGEIKIWDIQNQTTYYTRKFRERIIYLYYNKPTSLLYVVSEGEIASIHIHKISRGITKNISSKENESISKQLNDVEIVNKSIPYIAIAEYEKIILQKFTAKNGGTLCEIDKIEGGHSGASIFRARVFAPNGSVRFNTIAKIGNPETINKEINNYNNEISRLHQSITPRNLGQIFSNEGDYTAIFYSLEENCRDSFFNKITLEKDKLADTIFLIKDYFASWNNNVPMSNITIKEIRRTILGDDVFRKLLDKFSIEWADIFENQIISAKICTTHGDLHGNNILISDSGTPIVIDYEKVASRPASIDPITLELSLYIHPNSPFSSSNWLSSSTASSWGSNEYIFNSPAPNVTRRCFDWAESVSAGRREIAACAYAYLIWQLKFTNTDKSKIIKLLSGIKKYFSNT